MKNIHRLWLLLLVAFLLPQTTFAKEACKKHLTQLRKVQAKQRAGYSAKQGVKLQEREAKARKAWWQCENSVTKSSKKSKKKVAKVKAKPSSSTLKTTAPLNYTSASSTPFKTSQAIVVTEKYQGEKKNAWIKFYQQPVNCSRPATLKIFAYCSEDKQHQRMAFEQQYREYD